MIFPKSIENVSFDKQNRGEEKEFFETRQIANARFFFSLFRTKRIRKKKKKKFEERVHTCPREKNVNSDVGSRFTPRRGGCTLSALYKCNMIIYPWKYTIAK